MSEFTLHIDLTTKPDYIIYTWKSEDGQTIAKRTKKVRSAETLLHQITDEIAPVWKLAGVIEPICSCTNASGCICGEKFIAPVTPAFGSIHEALDQQEPVTPTPPEKPPKLMKLPGGAWLDFSEVAALEPHQVGTTSHVRIHFTGGGTMLVNSMVDPAEAAEAMANIINDHHEDYQL